MKYDLVDRRCIVTGATSGIGKEIARNLAYFGGSVVLACRNRDKGSQTLQELAEDSENDRLTVMQVDMSSLESIRNFVRQVTAGNAPVHVLVNNAGIVSDERETSTNGYELTWATNVLGYFALTNLLLPALARSTPSRVVNVASKFAGGLDLDDLEFERRRYRGSAAYAQSKQANRMLSWGLHRHLTGKNISVHACHPGGVATPIYDGLGGLTGALVRLGRNLFLKTPARGAITPTFLAADPEVQHQSGQFWIDRKPVPCKFAEDPRIDELWARCVEMTRTDASV